MNQEQLHKAVDDIRSEIEVFLGGATSADLLREQESSYVGKKSKLGQLLSKLGEFPSDQKAQVGKLLNTAKGELTQLYKARIRQLEELHAATPVGGAFDPTLPGIATRRGGVHPVTAVQWEVEEIFERLGFTIEAGPEMETDYYNFEALNIPAWHPARDIQDTFWLENGMLLRTHTSPVQVRAMEKFGPPLRCIVPGRCFRSETIDASHENTFHQCEGLLIDKGISIANLIAVMKLLLREVFARDVSVRLRPGYFPFVEPGFELDMSCLICQQKGCPTCKRSGWIELMPCGMVHPNVLRYGGIDPHEYSGFAFGLGLTRLAMLKYGVRDIRVMNSSDLRGLYAPEQLSGPVILSKEVS